MSDVELEELHDDYETCLKRIWMRSITFLSKFRTSKKHMENIGVEHGHVTENSMSCASKKT